MKVRFGYLAALAALASPAFAAGAGGDVIPEGNRQARPARSFYGVAPHSSVHKARRQRRIARGFR